MKSKKLSSKFLFMFRIEFHCLLGHAIQLVERIFIPEKLVELLQHIPKDLIELLQHTTSLHWQWPAEDLQVVSLQLSFASDHLLDCDLVRVERIQSVQFRVFLQDLRIRFPKVSDSEIQN